MWEQSLGEVTLNSAPSLDTQMMSLCCVPDPHSEEHCVSGEERSLQFQVWDPSGLASLLPPISRPSADLTPGPCVPAPCPLTGP